MSKKKILKVVWKLPAKRNTEEQPTSPPSSSTADSFLDMIAQIIAEDVISKQEHHLKTDRLSELDKISNRHRIGSKGVA